MTEYSGPEPIARSPITVTTASLGRGPHPVSRSRSDDPVSLTDLSARTKITVRAGETGPMAKGLGIRFGRAVYEGDWLVIGSGPDEWLVLGPAADASRIDDWLTELAESDPDPVSVVDVTHGRALMRLTGDHARIVLSKLCAIDFADELVPTGGALRTSVAKVVTDVVRDDTATAASYLLHCERSSGQYLWDSLVDAGQEFSIDTAVSPA